jgi:hypothetical protein
MLGCFQYLFFSKGLGLKSILVIWIHGTLEISAMIISATAGFIIARSILFPGSFRRIVSFKRGMKDALKIMIIFVPMTFGAAFLESYVTHLMSESFDTDGKDGMPVWASLLILAFSLSFVLWYFIVYPLRLESKLKRIPKPEPNVSVID